MKKGLMILWMCVLLWVLCACQSTPNVETLPPDAVDFHTSAPVEATEEMIPVVDIAKQTPKTFSYPLGDSQWQWTMEDVEVLLPDNLKSFDVLQAKNGGALDMDALSNALFSPTELSDSKVRLADVENYWRQSGEQAQVRQTMSGEYLAVGIMLREGFFRFTRDVPDAYRNPADDGGMLDGHLSSNGLAKNSNLLPEEAVQKAMAFLEKLKLPFHYQVNAAVAFSPDLEGDDPTALTRGYYTLQIAQIIDEKPVARHYTPTGLPELLDGQILRWPLGGDLRVFDVGVLDCTLLWLDESVESIEKVERILSLPAAAERVSDTILHSNRSTMRRDFYMPVDIQTIRLEYAIEKLKDGVARLVPCWSFVNNSGSFVGIRINALTGETMLAIAATPARKGDQQ